MKAGFLILATVLAALQLPAQSNQPARLALISEVAETAAASDVLTAQLSTNSQVQLLERNAIDKVYREQGLSAMNADYLKLGRILGADGLLILHLSKEANSKRLSVRLVAVKPGVTLLQREYPWPLDDPLQWAKVVALQFQPLFVKLAVVSNDALPISILNLHSAVASLPEETLEHELTELLYARLINEKNIFVLERRRMDLLRQENQFNQTQENTFWDGGYLLDGVIDKTGYEKDTVSIEVQLTPPNKQKVLTVTVSGARTNLVAVVNDLAAKILAALNRKLGTTEWNPQAEADRYFTEGQWLFRWGMYQEANSAAEAAWALGKQNPEVAKLRIKAYQACAGDPGICVVVNGQKRVVFGQQINPNVLDFSQVAAYASAPSSVQFSDLIRAGELFRNAFHWYVRPDKKLDPAWLNLGEAILKRTSLWLRYYYFTAEARSGQEARIEEAKQLCLSINRLMEDHAGFADTDTNQTLLIVTARNAAFWVDTPEQCLPIYRAIIDAGEWPLVRKRFFNADYSEVSLQLTRQGVLPYANGEVSDGTGRFDPNDLQALSANPANPCLNGWTWAERKRCPEFWSGFIDQLCASSKPPISLEGRILRCSYSWSEADFEHNLNQLFDYVRQQHDEIFRAEDGSQLLDDLHTLVDDRGPALTKTRRDRIEHQSWPSFKQQFAVWLKEFTENQARQSFLAAKEKYLNSQTNFDFISFNQVFLDDDYRPVEARELLPLVTNYEKRVVGSASAGNGNSMAAIQRKMEQQQAKFWINSLEDKLTKIISPPPPRTNAPPVTHIARASAPSRGLTASVAQASKPAIVPTNVAAETTNDSPINVARFWTIPTPKGVEDDSWGSMASYTYDGEEYVPQIASCCYRDGKLWVEVRYDQFGNKGRADFFGIDLQTFAVQKVEFEGQEFSLPNLIYRSNTHPFDVYNGFLYLSIGNSISRYSFKEHSWEQFPVPASGKIMPVCLGNRLFFTTSSSILEYVSDGSFRTLASSRRQPPMNILDRIVNYGSPHLFLTAGNMLHVRIGNGIYAFSTKTNDWFTVAQMQHVDESNYHPSDNGFVTLCGSFPGEWAGMFGHMSSPEVLFQQPLPKGTIMIGPRKQKPTSAYWKMDIPSIEMFFQSDHLWFLVGSPTFRADASRYLQVENGTNTCLLRFTHGEKEPIRIPLRIESGNIRLTPVAAGMLRNPPELPWAQKWTLQWTPQGLVLIARSPVPGFWFVPAKELQAAVDRVHGQQRLRLEAIHALHERWRKDLLKTYDRNHNGILDPMEREAMIDDPHYLELELPIIDMNGNGLLDAGELRFFDANSNRVLDPNEQKAIASTLVLLADRLIAKAGPDANGGIDPAELPPGLVSTSTRPPWVHLGMEEMRQRDGRRISREELVDLLRSYLTRGLQVNGQPLVPLLLQGTPLNAESLFKARVDAYWKLTRMQTDLPNSSAFSHL